jgi:hypothetical protein
MQDLKNYHNNHQVHGTGLHNQIKLHQSKIKDNAEIVMLFLQLVLWNLTALFSELDFNHSPNNNYVIAQLHTETMDAMVDLWTTALNMLWPMVLPLKLLIHTLEFKEHAKLTEVHSKLQVILMLHQTTAAN